MKIAVIEPFYSGSHRQWLDGMISHSSHTIDRYSLPGRYWKWRMHGAAVTLAQKFLVAGKIYDLILVTDMIDLAQFKARVSNRINNTPIWIYFHENQLAYPWSSNDQDVKLKRDLHYAWINICSAHLADRVIFNSRYNRDSFLNLGFRYLEALPDHQCSFMIDDIRQKSHILPLGLNLSALDLDPSISSKSSNEHVILWNHRWEEDKNPKLFFETLMALSEENISFRLIVLGKEYSRSPKIFTLAKQLLREHIDHWGYVDDRYQYTQLLHQATILPVTSYHDFFGISVMEAAYCGAYLFLPRRMSYPDLFEDIAQYYDKDDEYLKMLENILRAPVFNKIFDQKEQLKGYDWKNMIKIYDTFFETKKM